jgi:hypothetical protein
VTTSTTVTDPHDEACPGCRKTVDVRQVLATPPGVYEGACSGCGMGWAITTVNPQPYLDRLTAAVERLTAARSLSRRLHALAEEAPMITNEELRDRLLALADRARALP